MAAVPLRWQTRGLDEEVGEGTRQNTHEINLYSHQYQRRRVGWGGMSTIYQSTQCPLWMNAMVHRPKSHKIGPKDLSHCSPSTMS
jgi:hypothetical protein